jgi:hypothetical protein
MPKRVRSWPVLLLLAIPLRLLVADVAVPPELQPWQSWVLQGEEFRRCPYATGSQAADAGAFRCAWPERLALDLDAHGGRFAQRWELFAESWISLPGDLEHWPREVQLDGARAAVVMREGIPQIHLSTGSHFISGSFRWARRPEALTVPAEAGIIALTIEGRPVAQPERSGNAVWLGQRRGAVEPQQLSLQVYRLLSDDIPAALTTQIRVQAAGEAREELLAPVLPKGFVPMSLASELPARLEPDGRLRVQARAGNWQIVLVARAPGVADVLRRPAGEGAWASDEIWSFQGIDRLRVAAVEAWNRSIRARPMFPPIGTNTRPTACNATPSSRWSSAVALSRRATRISSPLRASCGSISHIMASPPWIRSVGGCDRAGDWTWSRPIAS